MSLFSVDFLHTGSATLLVGAVLLVGVLHTIVPDHWVPITLIARQRGWTRGQTAMAALKAGTGHVVTTLILAAIVWGAGVAFATKFGHWVDIISSIALVAFGLWIAITSWFAARKPEGGGHSHGTHGHAHDFSHLEGSKVPNAEAHGPELQSVQGKSGKLALSIYEAGQPPRFRFTATSPERVRSVWVETSRPGGGVQLFEMSKREGFWESLADIPEPHGFKVTLKVEGTAAAESFQMDFAEHDHGHGDAEAHKPKTSSRTALLLILGSSPMVEGIPAFFAASKYGPGVIAVMSLVFAASTILTYVLLCVYSTAGLKRMKFGALERYGEVLSGAFIALVGVVFWLFPVL